MIVVGRSALINRTQNLYQTYRGQTNDLDVWGTSESVDSHKFEFGAKLDYCCMPEEVMKCFEHTSHSSGVASLYDLLAIKLSHLQYDIFWWKHVQDSLYIQHLIGNNYNKKLYAVLVEHWKREHGGDKSKLSLYKTKDEFFDDFVPKKYEHDYLHVLVAQGNNPDSNPVYTRVLKEGEEVAIDRKKFELCLSFAEQVRMFKEEVAVIALERWIIPSLTNKAKSNMTISKAWNKSLHKTVTALTKNWASEFIVLNLKEFLNPLTTEMMHTLEILNLKEKYMSNIVSYKDIKLEMLKRAKIKHERTSFEDSLDRDEYDTEEERIEAKLEYFEEYLDLNYSIAHGDFWYTEKIEGYEFIQQSGGGEGGTEDCETVFRFDGQLYKLFYNYYSHDGYRFDEAELRKVKPVERVVTFYENE